jgi:hypothetical protein
MNEHEERNRRFKGSSLGSFNSLSIVLIGFKNQSKSTKKQIPD